MKPKPKTKWPKVGDMVYYFDTNHLTESGFMIFNNPFDNFLYPDAKLHFPLGFYKTRESAESALKKIKSLVKKESGK